MMKLFETEKELPFLFMDQRESGLTLKAVNIPVSYPLGFGDLFTTVDVSHIISSDMTRMFCANIISNRIAALSRRAVGNILFVPDNETKTWFEETNGRVANSRHQHVIVDERLQPNELRSAFWKIIHNGKAVDGGIQISPDGFHCLPNYKSYFTRCFMV